MTSKKVLEPPIINTNQRIVSSLTNVFLSEFTRLTRSRKFQRVFDILNAEKNIFYGLKIKFSIFKIFLSENARSF
jgi:hypothetical protein